MIARSSLTRFGTIFLGLVALVCVAAVQAQDAQPAVRAARLTIAQGMVTVYEPGSAGNGAEDVAGQENLPLLSGVQVTTGSDGQAEIEFEDGSVVRMTPNSQLSLDTLAIDSTGVFVTDMSLLHGLVYCELRATSQYSFVLNAGGDMLSPVENTIARVSFDQPPASFAVLDGTAQVERQGSYEAQVLSGETLQTDATNNGRYFLSQGIAADTWDQWNEDLDQAATSASANSTGVRDGYAGADGYGWSDLDANGSWYNVPGEGEVWQPDVAVSDSGFDPYANGSWVYYSGMGYVWASGYSWGWTPYRCGNWSYYNGFGWGWLPGTGCGAGGWGFGRSGGPVNIRRYPPGYHPVRVPTPRPGPLRPILPVRPMVAGQGQQTGQFSRGPRMINGQAVTRIAPVRGAVSAGAPGQASSLRRDFPINAANHTHELGVTATGPGVGRPQQPQGQYGQSIGRPGNGGLGNNGPGMYRNQQNGQPANGGSRTQPYPANTGARPAPTTPAVQQPQGQPLIQHPTVQQTQPAPRNDQQRNEPRPTSERPPNSQVQPPQQRTTPQEQRYTPPPQQQQQRYTPPPQQQQRYTPPPQAQQQRESPPPPRSSPPPAPPSPPPSSNPPPPQPPAQQRNSH
jgi:hypothetical protein